MKKAMLLLAVVFLLCSCAAEETVETVADEWVEPAAVTPRGITLDLPGDAAVCAMESDSGRLYLSDGYEISVQTLSGGDLDSSIRAVTGFSKEDLTVMQTRNDGVTRYEFVWAAEGEQGDRMGHGVLLDDGNYHYCLTVLQDVDAMDTCQVIWSQVFHSFDLA